VRTLQLPISLAAIVATLAAGAAVRDRLLGVSIAGVASLVLLPITWFHYPSALMPFAIAAIARAPGGRPTTRTRLLVAAAVVVAALSIAWLPGVWIAVALVVVAVASSSSGSRIEATT
jgi:hypothetical protein